MQIVRKRPRESDQKVARLPARPRRAHHRSHDGRALQRARAKAGREVSRRRRRQWQPQQRRVDVLRWARGYRTARSRMGWRCSPSRPSAFESSGSATWSSTAPNNGWPRFTSAPTASATRPRADPIAQEYVSYFLNDEPSPGIAYEYQLVKQLLPTITAADASTMARALLGDDSRVILADVAAEDRTSSSRPKRTSRRRSPGQGDAGDARGPTRRATRALMEHAARGRRASLRGERCDDVGVTVVRFANGVEAWLKPTDFKNDRSSSP